MIKKFLFFFLSVTVVFGAAVIKSSKNSARLGNNMLPYIEGRWMSYKYGIPFYYEPFQHSENLNLSDIETKFSFGMFPRNYTTQEIKDLNTPLNPEMDIIYVFRFHGIFIDRKAVLEMKKDKEFLKILRGDISPKKELNLIYPPKDIHSVAVHVRKGTGYDAPLKSVQIFSNPDEVATNIESAPSRKKQQRVDQTFPLMLPPEQYYIDQIKWLSQKLNNQKIYAFIFTDDPNPIPIVNRIKREVGLDNVIYDCRHEATGHNINVLDDLFSMVNFQYFIRSRSSFAETADIIGNFKIVIFPTASKWEKINNREYLIMTKIEREEY